MTTRPPAPDAAPSTRSIATDELLGTARELLIRHKDETYRLCLTRNDKLILIK